MICINNDCICNDIIYKNNCNIKENPKLCPKGKLQECKKDSADLGGSVLAETGNVVLGEVLHDSKIKYQF